MLLSEIVLILALVILFARWFLADWDRRRTEKLIVAVFYAFPAVFLAEIICVGFVTLITHFEHLRYDLYVYNFDCFLGNPSFFLGRWVAGHRFLTGLVTEVYNLQVLAMVSVFAVYVYCCEEQTSLVLRTFILNVLVEFPFYFVFPVSGPKFAFPDFPRAHGLVHAHRILLTAAPNGVPSIHNSTAMLVAALLWRWPAGRIAGTLFVLLTMFATMANGQHYAFDLLSSIPYSWLVWKLAHHRARATAAGLDESAVQPVPARSF